MMKYRENRAAEALLDEYQKTIQELKKVLDCVSPNELITIVDTETKDANCRSIQTILTHVINAGYYYVIEIRKFLGEKIDYKQGETWNSIEEYKIQLNKMFEFNTNLFDDYPKLKIEETENDKKIVVRWRQLYDVEQLYEHAIVHILRHRRQIEQYLIKLNENEI